MSISPPSIVDRFKQGLEQAEQSRDPAPIARLFSGDAKLHNLGANEKSDAHIFWRNYLEQFREIKSEFTHESLAENSATLEWHSHGVGRDGEPVDYTGVSILEYQDDAITAFRTYYDTAAFVKSKATT